MPLAIEKASACGGVLMTCTVQILLREPDHQDAQRAVLDLANPPEVAKRPPS